MLELVYFAALLLLVVELRLGLVPPPARAALPIAAPVPAPEPAALVAVLVEPEASSTPPPPSSRTRHPIVLVHGLLGFDQIGFGPARSDYFRGIRRHLELLGNQVHVVRLPAAAGVRRRAERLVDQVQSLPGERVNLVAHSLGGLDARYAISRLGLAPRVASLTTIGTPHRGTPLADGFGPLLARLGLEGAGDASTRRMSSFNQDVIDVPDVEYLSVVAIADTLLWRMVFPGVPSDGLVPAHSQTWGRVVSEVQADHWAQIGWSRRFDAVDLYERLLIELSSRGL